MKKVLTVIGGIVVAIIVIFIILYIITSSTSSKLKCRSDEGNITLMYNDKNLTGYTANGISYDLDAQQEIADQIGIEEYLDQFKVWFESNTTGTCE